MSIKMETGTGYFSPKDVDVKSASHGYNGASMGGTKREFISAKMGNNFPRPNDINNASNGQTDGHNMGAPAQTRGYPNASPVGAAPNTIKSITGRKEYMPKSGDAKMASSGEGPNSKGGMSRSFPKKGMK